ncbi:MAG TPA: serine/threonine-protein kinase [Kofleriaceae bacterium]|nr:serine/threonine-protein kinase [Kofleriaceae bacterium]
MTRALLKTLRLPFESIRTIYAGQGEVRLYRNEITGVEQVGKRVSALGLEKASVFREARVLQALRHDHLVPILDVAVVEPVEDKLIQTIEMIIPYYPRGSICDALLRGEQFTIAESVQFVRDGLQGLDELHERQRLIHRDMKSPNILIDDRGRGRVGDLGIAIPMSDDGTAEAFHTTQIYAAPEIFTTQQVDRRTDLYGIGLVLFELLNGRLPYDEYDTDSIVKRLEKGQRPIKKAHLVQRPIVPPRIRQVINKAIAVDPAERYATSRQMLAAIDQAPFIDWRLIQNEDAVKVWEGATLAEPKIQYRVTATKAKRGSEWKLLGQKHINAWQRCVEDQTVPGPAGVKATAFFDQIVRHATNL